MALWSQMSGYVASEKLSDKLRYVLQPLSRYRQFCEPDDAVGKNRGDTFNWTVYGDLTNSGRKLTETENIPETNAPASTGTLVIEEFGNSVPFSSKYDDLSEHPVTQIIEKQLKDDCNKTLDKEAYNTFNDGKLQAVGGSGGQVTLSENGTPSGSNGQQLTSAHVRTIVDIMAERNIPTWNGSDYCAIARPSTLRPLKNDLESIRQYTGEGYGQITNGEVGRYEGVKFIQATSVPSEGWNSGKSDAAFFFGSDVAVEGVAIPEEVRGRLRSDFGRKGGVAWYYLGGFARVHNDAAQARVIKWASAS